MGGQGSGWSGIGKAKKKPKGQIQEKTLRRIQLAARIELQNLGLTDDQIAEHVGIKASSFQRIKRLPLYRQIKNELFTGVLSAASEEVAKNYTYQRRIMDDAVPEAIQSLVELATQRKDRRIQLQAISELLDRQGKHIKVSRTAVQVVGPSAVANAEDNEIAQELAKALSK